jgi:hypothetical protein
MVYYLKMGYSFTITDVKSKRFFKGVGNGRKAPKRRRD